MMTGDPLLDEMKQSAVQVSEPWQQFEKMKQKADQVVEQQKVEKMEYKPDQVSELTF